MSVDANEVAQTLDSVTTTIAGFTPMQVLVLALLIVVCVILRRVILAIAEKAIVRLRVEKSLHGFIRSALSVLLWFVIFLIVADYIGIPVTSLLTVLSLIGLAVSLAIQGTLSNLAGGIMLLSAKPFVVGDFVEAGGVSGTVTEIGLVYTKVTTVDNKVIFAPNSEISGSKIINYTHQKTRRVDLVVSASYEAPVEKVEGTLAGLLEEDSRILRDPAPFARVSGYGASAIEYTLRAWCATESYWEVYFDLLRRVKTAFDRAGIEMTYDHLNVHIEQRKAKGTAAE